jgi:hypothetical protein
MMHLKPRLKFLRLASNSRRDTEGVSHPRDTLVFRAELGPVSLVG